MSKAMLYIEAPKEKTILKARNAIIDILKSANAQGVKREALRTFASVCHVQAIVTNCTFVGNAKLKKKKATQRK